MGTQYLNPLSGDMLGRQLARSARRRAWPGRADAGACAQCAGLAALDAEGKASYSFYRDGVADRQVTAAALAACAALPELRVVATGCLALVAQDAAIYQPWLAQRAAGRLVVVDANLRLSAVDDAGLPRQCDGRPAARPPHQGERRRLDGAGRSRAPLRWSAPTICSSKHRRNGLP